MLFDLRFKNWGRTTNIISSRNEMTRWNGLVGRQLSSTETEVRQTKSGWQRSRILLSYFSATELCILLWTDLFWASDVPSLIVIPMWGGVKSPIYGVKSTQCHAKQEVQLNTAQVGGDGDHICGLEDHESGLRKIKILPMPTVRRVVWRMALTRRSTCKLSIWFLPHIIYASIRGIC